MTQIFCHYRDDASFVFQRGADTVHVNIDTSKTRTGRLLRHCIWGFASVMALVPGAVFPPLLIVFVFVVLGWYGWATTWKGLLYEQAELEARKQFDRMEAERWAAMRSFKG